MEPEFAFRIAWNPWTPPPQYSMHSIHDTIISKCLGVRTTNYSEGKNCLTLPSLRQQFRPPEPVDPLVRLKLGFRFLGKVSLLFRKMKVDESECKGEERGSLVRDALPVRPSFQNLVWTGNLFFEGLDWAAPMSLTCWVPTS